MSNIDLSSYSKEELRDVLRVLKDYRTSLKQIGLRSEFCDIKIPKKNYFTIEYTSSADFDFIQNFADSACKKFFGEADLNATKKFVVNEKIIWGIRIFYGNDMVDLSFQDAVSNLI